MKREFTVRIRFDDEGEGALPSEREVIAALAYSTAAEALAEATGCRVFMELEDSPPGCRIEEGGQ
jgi:hypothetical protein